MEHGLAVKRVVKDYITLGRYLGLVKVTSGNFRGTEMVLALHEQNAKRRPVK